MSASMLITSVTVQIISRCRFGRFVALKKHSEGQGVEVSPMW